MYNANKLGSSVAGWYPCSTPTRLPSFNEVGGLLPAAGGNGVRMDPLQRLHTLVNLAALLAAPVPHGAAAVPRTLRDDRLLVGFLTYSAINLVCEYVTWVCAAVVVMWC